MARRRKPRPPLPAPQWSACVYVELENRHVGLFRFLLEAEDNLAYMSVVDRWKTVLQVVFSPHQKDAALRYLESMQATVPFTILPLQQP